MFRNHRYVIEKKTTEEEENGYCELRLWRDRVLKVFMCRKKKGEAGKGQPIKTSVPASNSTHSSRGSRLQHRGGKNHMVSAQKESKKKEAHFCRSQLGGILTWSFWEKKGETLGL